VLSDRRRLFEKVTYPTFFLLSFIQGNQTRHSADLALSQSNHIPCEIQASLTGLKLSMSMSFRKKPHHHR
jgi:hypothetical protein